MSQAVKSKAVSLEDLIALNEEIASLVRAGVPLDRGLLATGADMPGKLGALTSAIAIELSKGATLPEAIASERVALPRVYRAVVTAGLRSGRLATALESLTGFLRRLAESRREIASSLIYPVLVVVVAWCVGYGLFNWVVPEIHKTLLHMTFDRSPLTDWLPMVSAAWLWLGAIPVVLVLLTGWIWYCSGRATLAQGAGAAALLGWVPWLGRMVQMTRIATFTDVLALLVEHGVPLDESVVLAAETTGHVRTVRSAHALAERLAAGGGLDRGRLRELAIPPLLGWMLASGLRQRALLAALEQAAKTYRRRAAHAAEAARVFLPVFFTMVIGGTAVAISGLGLFFPYICMMDEMTRIW